MSLSLAEQYRLAQIERELSGETVLGRLCAQLASTSAEGSGRGRAGWLRLRPRPAGRASAARRLRRTVGLVAGAVCLMSVGPVLLLAGELADAPGLLSAGGALLPLAIGGLMLLGVAALGRYRRGRGSARPGGAG